MQKILFKGFIVNGIGKHNELYVPGRKELPESHPDWPVKLCSGSMNVRVNHSGYPREFRENGWMRTVKALDTAKFKAPFGIRQDQFGNNRLKPTGSMQNRGDAQVWKATLKAGGQSIPCWVLRRFGSGLSRELELVSDMSIRETYGFTVDREWPCEVELYGEWADS
jgi:hypothetical protein